MTWPEVVRWLVLFMGAAAPLMAVIWTVGRIFRPWMRSEAQEAANQVRAEVRALADKLATNDLPHMENRIVKQMELEREDRKEMGAQLGKRLDRMGARLDRMDAKMDKRLDRIETWLDRMDAKMDKRLDRIETLLLAPNAPAVSAEVLDGP